ncbi:MAG: Na+/H+ antiporter NhaC family protein, partial [Oscillospiraceae bacterium]|nr:Na+/H+ antiporter NhaC family protein [Oscillospiraceae bacterium]
VYLIRRVISFKVCMECIPEGFKAMVPAILILTFAWTLKNMTSSLGADVFVDTVVREYVADLQFLLPAIIFLIAAAISFATGTSWGTFGILIPIVVSIFENVDPTMMVISISACMAGSVCGDHCSPISDTTIMASAGARCVHVKHVSTQLPYAITVAAISFVMYIVAAFVKDPFISLAIGLALTVAVLLLLKRLTSKNTDKHNT